MKDPLLKVENLSRHFMVKKNMLSPGKAIQAVKDVSFDLYRGETLGLVGESGSGKSTLGNLVLCLLEANRGRIFFDGTDLVSLKETERRKIRKDLQIIFQYTNAVLDPLMTIRDLIGEALTIHSIVNREDVDREVDRLLDMVGLTVNEKGKYPHQLSGGQNQRIIIARAIAVRPKLIICDEPVSALDVSIQGQILNLLSDLQKELNLTYLFISHDLKVVSHLCSRIAVMYQGEIVECGERDQVLHFPEHDYTRTLLNSGLIPSC